MDSQIDTDRHHMSMLSYMFQKCLGFLCCTVCVCGGGGAASQNISAQGIQMAGTGKVISSHSGL